MKMTVAKLDERLTIVEGKVMALKEGQEVILGNTAEILTAIKTAQATTGFIKRHFPKLLLFAAGAGMFNPEITKLIMHMFGQ